MHRLDIGFVGPGALGAGAATVARHSRSRPRSTFLQAVEPLDERPDARALLGLLKAAP